MVFLRNRIWCWFGSAERNIFWIWNSCWYSSHAGKRYLLFTHGRKIRFVPNGCPKLSLNFVFQLSMQWSVQPENHLDLTKSKLNMDHFQRSRFMTNIREKYDTLRISQNRNLCLIWFLDYSSRCESSWCILGPSWYTSKKIRSIWLCWGCSSYQKQTYRYTRRFQDGLSVTLRFLTHFLFIFSIRVPHAFQLLTLFTIQLAFCSFFSISLFELGRVRQKWYHVRGTLIHRTFDIFVQSPFSLHQNRWKICRTSGRIVK